MTLAVLKNERPYLNHPYQSLEDIAGDNWEDTSVLEELINELQFRKTAFALYLRQSIEERLKELEYFRWASTEAHQGFGDSNVSNYRKEKSLLSLLGYETGQEAIKKGLNEKKKIS